MSSPPAQWKRFATILKDADLYIAIALLIFVMVSTFFGVVARYVFSASLQSLDEVSIIVFVWFLYFSMIYCIRTNSNIVVNAFDERMTRRTIKATEIIASLAVLVFTAAMTKYSLDLVNYNMQRTGGRTPMLSIPYYVTYAILPLSFAIFTLVTARRLLHLLQSQSQSAAGGNE